MTFSTQPAPRTPGVRLLQAIAVVLAAAGAVDAYAQACIALPVDCRVSSAYGPRYNPTSGDYSTEFHKGVDFACPMGTPIKAGISGKVVESKWSNRGGNMIFVRAGNRTIGYMHNERNIAPIGATVNANDVIALVGNTGRSTGPHLHFQINVEPGNTTVNPSDQLCTKPQLKPGVLQGEDSEPDDAGRSATAPSEGAPSMHDGLGMEGSLREMLADAIGSRTFNPDYRRQISTLSDVKLYAELAYMETLRLRMRQEIAATRERSMATNAMLQLLKAEQVLRPQIDAQRSAATASPRR